MKNILVITLAALLSASGAAQAQNEGSNARQEFSAAAVSVGGPGSPSGAATLRIVLTRISSEDERRRIVGVLSEVGQRALTDTLHGLKSVGTISFDSQLGYDLRYAEEHRNGDGSRRFFLLTDRPPTFLESWNNPQYSDYPFIAIEMRVDAQGRGRGTMVPAGKLTSSQDGRFIQLENYGTVPIQLNDIRQRN